MDTEIIYDLMDPEKFAVIVTITFATIAVGAYIFFGPRPGGRRRVPVLGLQNLGQTCFINTILQALGSCPIFIEWLNSQPLGEIGEELKNVLQQLSKPLPIDSYDTIIQPIDLLECLCRHGWRRNIYDNLQQDAHELMVFILSKIEDEILINVKNKHNGFDVIDDEKQALMENAVGDSPLVDKRHNHIKNLLASNINVHNTYASTFRGRYVNQISCSSCGHENALKYDNFDSLSLHLPSNTTMTHTLESLLDYFVKSEIIQHFECDKCNKEKPAPPSEPAESSDLEELPEEGEEAMETSLQEEEDEEAEQTPQPEPSPIKRKPKILSDAIKTVRLGKLGKCLCFHIHRTAYSSHGTYKRQDYVHFPEYLNMDKYTYNAVIREKELKKKMLLNGDIPIDEERIDFNRNFKGTHVYRLKAVVVHRGSAEHGHFVTYRRGPLQSSTRHRCSPNTPPHNQNISYDSRWYLTSDGDVTESSLAAALQSVAYMIFYEKCSSSLVQTNGVTNNINGNAMSSSNFNKTNNHQTKPNINYHQQTIRRLRETKE